jgi:hypothetical protein
MVKIVLLRELKREQKTCRKEKKFSKREEMRLKI